jgi:Zn-dependent peptidase ImmA (M78 family)
MQVKERSAEPLSRSAYYQDCRLLAQNKRVEHDVETKSLNLLVMAKIYKKEGIIIDRRKLKGHRIRAAYYCDDGECSVLLNKTLPREPKLFALAHELKHHYRDQATIRDGKIQCGDYNAHEVIEKGAEVFAAEFIYPEAETRNLIDELRITSGTCTAESLVRFKRQCPACVSYKFIVKRFEWLKVCPKGAYDKIQFTKLEQQMFGTPIYQQEWFKEHRARKRQSKTHRQ